MKQQLFLLLVVAPWLCCSSFADDSQNWMRGFTSEGAASTDLSLIGVGQRGGRLRGLFVYDNDRIEPVIIAGVRNSAGEFWADASLQVKKTKSAEWRTVGKSTGKGGAEKSELYYLYRLR